MLFLQDEWLNSPNFASSGQQLLSVCNKTTNMLGGFFYAPIWHLNFEG
jgi:hypothetical protein